MEKLTTGMLEILQFFLGLLSLYILWKLFVFVVKIIIWVSSYSPPRGPSTTPPGGNPYFAQKRYFRDLDKYERLKAQREEKKQKSDDGLIKRLINDYHDMYEKQT